MDQLRDGEYEEVEEEEEDLEEEDAPDPNTWKGAMVIQKQMKKMKLKTTQTAEEETSTNTTANSTRKRALLGDPLGLVNFGEAEEDLAQLEEQTEQNKSKKKKKKTTEWIQWKTKLTVSNLRKIQLVNLANLNWSADKQQQQPQQHQQQTTSVKPTFKEADIDLFSQTFSPSLFLSAMHHNTRYNDLVEKGVENLQDNMESEEEEMRTFIRQNIKSFFDSKDMIDHLYQKSEDTFHSPQLSKLDSHLKSLQKSAEFLFGPLIENKQTAEHIRKSLLLLDRYKFIFSLPQEIQQNMKQGNFQRIVTDYNSAKYFMKRYQKKQQSSPGIFETVLKSIQQLIDEIKGQLFKQLLLSQIPIYYSKEEAQQQETALRQMSQSHQREESIQKWNSSLQQEEEYLLLFDLLSDPSSIYGQVQANAVSVLHHLDAKDPATYYLNEMYQFILRIIRMCNKKEALEEIIKQQQQQCTKEEGVFLILKKCISVTVKYMQNMSVLCDGILSGKFLTKNATMTIEQQSNWKPKQQEYLKRKQLEIINLFDSIVEALQAKMEEFFAWEDLSKQIFHPLLCQLTLYILQCYQKFSLKYNVKEIYTNSFKKFAERQRKWIVMDTWQSTVKEITNLYKQESLQSTPLLLQQYMSRAMSLTRPFIIDGEDALLSTVKQQFVESMVSYTDSLFSSLFLLMQTKQVKAEDALLLLLSNSMHVRDVVLEEELYEFAHQFYHTSTEAAEEEENSFVRLSKLTETKKQQPSSEEYLNVLVEELKEDIQIDTSITKYYNHMMELILKQFVVLQRDKLLHNLQYGFFLAGYDYFKSPLPNSIRPFILEILLDLSLIHSKLTTVQHVLEAKKKKNTSMDEEDEEEEEDVIKYVFFNLSDRLAELFMEYVRQLGEVSKNGAFQLDIEIQFVRTALVSFETEYCKRVYMELKAHLHDISEYRCYDPYTKKIKNKIIQEFTEKTRIQLACFAMVKKGKADGNHGLLQKSSFREMKKSKK